MNAIWKWIESILLKIRLAGPVSGDPGKTEKTRENYEKWAKEDYGK